MHETHGPRPAVILDTETTGLTGYICEIAIIDAATGQTLVNTLVNPHHPVEPEAHAIHQIPQNEIESAPDLSAVMHLILQATKDKTIIAYNAHFDESTLRRHANRDALQTRWLGEWENWWCAQQWRTQIEGKRKRLNGGHRALDDARATRALLSGKRRF